MPSKISHVHISVGDKVKIGQPLMILEAMKMEVKFNFIKKQHIIKSPKDGVIKKINYKVNELVGEGKVLVVFE
jgi:3-methylcrotonyl-CoA carboxylase alpha subunit